MLARRHTPRKAFMNQNNCNQSDPRQMVGRHWIGRGDCTKYREKRWKITVNKSMYLCTMICYVVYLYCWQPNLKSDSFRNAYASSALSTERKLHVPRMLLWHYLKPIDTVSVIVLIFSNVTVWLSWIPLQRHPRCTCKTCWNSQPKYT